MSQSTESRNKALVLEAFDTLFNKRDYAAAERFWSSNYAAIPNDGFWMPRYRFQFRRIQIMADKLVKSPGPDHPISIDANPSRFVVKVGGKVIADTSDALTLREASYPAVQYIPRRDVD